MCCINLNDLKVDGCYFALYWIVLGVLTQMVLLAVLKETGTEDGYAFLSAQLGLELGICLKWAAALKNILLQFAEFCNQAFELQLWTKFFVLSISNSDLPRIRKQ